MFIMFEYLKNKYLHHSGKLFIKTSEYKTLKKDFNIPNNVILSTKEIVGIINDSKNLRKFTGEPKYLSLHDINADFSSIDKHGNLVMSLVYSIHYHIDDEDRKKFFVIGRSSL